MNDTQIYKIKDSVDLFLSGGKYLTIYFMNSRQRKSFKVNDEMIFLLESIDGETPIGKIKEKLELDHGIDANSVDEIIDSLIHNRIITALSDNKDILAEDIIQRYTRQINYFSEFLEGDADGKVAQARIMSSTLLIFGCGAVGSNIALELAMAGVGKMILVDCDNVEAADLSRHLYYRKNTIGMPKVDALEKEIKRINSGVVIDKDTRYIRPETDIEEIICQADFVVNTLDEPYIGYTSAKISRLCMKHNIPHYIAGGFDAHLASTGELIIPYVTPCVECYANHFKVALKDWKPKSHPVRDRYTEIGGLASMTLFSASYACIEIIKCLTGIVNQQKNYKIRGEFLFNDMSLTYLNVQRDPDCPICGGKTLNES